MSNTLLSQMQALPRESIEILKSSSPSELFEMMKRLELADHDAAAGNGTAGNGTADNDAKAARLRHLRSKYGAATSRGSSVAAAATSTAPPPRWTLMPTAIAESTATSSRSHRQYRRLQQIGQGRFGQCFLCQDPVSERLFVLKTVQTKNVDAPARVEARAMLKLRKHPNIIELHDLFEDGPERIALVMEYADGGDLAGRIAAAREARAAFQGACASGSGTSSSNLGFERHGSDFSASPQLGFVEALHVFVQVAFALQHCHRHAVLHRDVKPANIFLTSQGIVRLGDFGIARDFHYASALESG